MLTNMYHNSLLLLLINIVYVCYCFEPLNDAIITYPQYRDYTREKKDIKIVYDYHSYYFSVFYSQNTGIFDNLWVDLSLNTSHHVGLSTKYDRYLIIPFDFVFYGHKLSSVGITTAGFVSALEYSHPYIHFSQYIAPLSSDFNPNISDSSRIYYEVLEDRLTVQWEQVKLNANETAGNFTFQTVILTNGTIYFLYKEMPLTLDELASFSESKIGLSDAFTLTIGNYSLLYRYHTISLGSGMQLYRSVIKLIPLANCVFAESCQECRDTTQNTDFTCEWCDELSLCSDGFDRHRQEWLDEDCASKSTIILCSFSSYVGSNASVIALGITVPILVIMLLVLLIMYIAYIYMYTSYLKSLSKYIKWSNNVLSSTGDSAMPRNNDLEILQEPEEAVNNV